MRLPSKGWLGALGALVMLSSLGVAHAQNQGLLGQYYVVAPLAYGKPNRAALFGCKTPAFTRVDPRIDFEWGSTGPTDLDGGDPPDVNGAPFTADGFAARWTGTLKPSTTGDVVIIGRSDDGIRVWLKEKSKGAITSTDAPIVDAWVDRGTADTDSAPISLTAGTEYYIQVEYYENGGGAAAHLNWRPASDADDANAVAVPETELTPATPPAAGADSVAPGAAAGLSVSGIGSTTAKLSFTAPGDDAGTGTAGCYDARYSTTAINDSNFDQAKVLDIGSAVPDVAGSSQSIDLINLPALENIYVAIRAQDEAGNVGPVASAAAFQTLPASSLPEHGVTSEDFYGATAAGVCLDGEGDAAAKNFPKFVANAPDLTAFYPHFELYGVDDINVDPGNDRLSNFLTRMRAIFTAPMDGAYTFYEAADDDAELSISDPVTGTAMPDEKTLKVIAGNPDCNWAPDRAWGRFSQDGPNTDDPAAASVSAPITLKKGDRVELQLLRQESGGGENMAVGAIFPDGTDGTGTEQVDPNIGYDNTNNAPSAADMKNPAFMRPLNGKYLTPWPLPATGRVRGTVTDGSGNPVWSGKVTVNVGGKDFTTTTDSAGGYSLLVSPGAATIKAEISPWTSANGSASATVASDKISEASIQIPFTMPPFKPASPDADKSDDFSGALKSVWQAEDIDTDAPGASATAGGMLNVTGIGSDIWDGGDHFRYVYQNISGDFEAVLHVVNVPTTDVWSKTGLMARASTDGLIHHAFAAATMGNGPSMQGRTVVSDTDGTDTNVNVNLGGNFPAGGYWVKLIRQGKMFHGFWSQDGVKYQYLSTVDFSNSEESAFADPGLLLGIASTTHDAAPVDGENPQATVDDFIFSGTVAQPTAGGTGPTVKLGDLNNDGKVNVQDATTSLRIAVGSITPTDAQKAAGDVNHDGKWNVQDTTLILRFAVGAITAFP